MLLVSDNDAYNRLYEFLGQQYINDQLHQKGYAAVQITHRLDIDLTEDEDRHTNPVKFLGPGNKVLYQQPAQYNATTFAVRTDKYKYIAYNGIWDTNELFDLENDPYEMNNLIRNKDMDKIGLQLRNELYDWLEKTNGLQIPLKKIAERKNDHLYRGSY